MKDKSSNIPIIIVCLILAIFFIFILITLFNTKNIRDNTEPNYELQNSQIDVYKEKKSNYIVANPVIKKEIASYKTKILDNEENRIYNIKLACKNLNETIIKSGEEFSFNNKFLGG